MRHKNTLDIVSELVNIHELRLNILISIVFTGLHLTAGGVQFHFTQADALRSDFYQFVFGDEFDGLIQRQYPRRS